MEILTPPLFIYQGRANLGQLCESGKEVKSELHLYWFNCLTCDFCETCHPLFYRILL